MPDRPAGVPDAATWDDSDDEWVLAERDADGEHHGVVTWWRPDGTRCCVTEYVHGTPHGAFTRYHENGEVSREGRFEDGDLHGTNVFRRSSAPTTERFPAGLGDAVARAEMDYARGKIVAARCYDASGRQCLEDGSPFPDARPPGVPDDAHFRKREDDGEYRWVAGAVIDRGDGTIARDGVWRFWTADGVLVAEEPYAGGALHGTVRRFAPDSGALVEEQAYVEGAKRGAFLRPIDDDDRGDGAAAFVRGVAEGDDPVGVIEYLDADQRAVATIEVGLADDLEATQGVLGAAAALVEVAQGHAAARRTGAAILAWARAVGRGEAPADRLRAALASLARPLSDGATFRATRRAKMVVSNIARFGGGPDKCVNHLMEGIRLGGDGPELLRHAAAVLDDMGASAIAREVIDAAIAVAPEDRATAMEYTRALVRASLGDADGARASAAALRAAGDDGAGIASYVAALFPTWDFWPARDARLAAAAELAPRLARVQPRRPLELALMRAVIQKSATRLVRHRARLVAAFGERPWIVPDVSHLLPDGPVEVPVPEDYEGIGIHHLARQEWTRLTWLCWMAGQTDVALPDELAPPGPYVPLYLIGRARLYLVHDADARGAVAEVLAASRDLADPADDEAIIDAAVALAGRTDWFGLWIEAIESAPDASFVQADDAAFMSALQPTSDLFGEQEADEDEDEDDEDDDDDED